MAFRVLVAHNFYRSDQPSGENSVVREDVKALQAAGHHVTELTPSSDSIHGLPPAQKALVAMGPIAYPPGLRQLQRLIRDTQPQVLHLHNPYPLISPTAIRVARRAGVAVVQTVHNYRQVCVAGTFFREGRICRECVPGRPLPGVRHACYRGSQGQSLAMAAGLTAHRSTWRLVHHYLALTDFQAQHVLTLGVEPTRISVRPTSAPDPGAVCPPGRDVVFVGRLDESKGLGLLLDAWVASGLGSQGRQLHIAGDGPLMAEIRQRSAGEDSVIVHGRLGPAEVSDLYDRAAFVVVPSLWFEGFPRVIAEAWSHGRPVLSCDNDNMRTIVDDTVGWLSPAAAQPLAEALRTAAEGDLATLSATSRARWLATLSPAPSLQALENAYEAAIHTAREEQAGA
jgi:glycosyltransferase involved in cell wall biosynthesis